MSEAPGPIKTQIQDMLNAGMAALQRDDLEAAGKFYDGILRLEPRHFQALQYLGIVCARKGDKEEAARLFGESLTINENVPAAYSNYGNVLLDLKRFAEALACYDKALALHPNYAGAYFNRGVCFNKLSRFEDAARDFAKVAELQSDYPYVAGMLLHARMQCCAWEDFDAQVAATYLVCDDAPIGEFGVAKYTSKDVPGKKSSFPVSGGAGGACYLFANVTFLQLNVASDSPRWWGRFYQSVAKKK